MILPARAGRRLALYPYAAHRNLLTGAGGVVCVALALHRSRLLARSLRSRGKDFKKHLDIS
jgi:hypothetical protein